MASAPVITRIETVRNPEYQEIVWTRIYSSDSTGLISNWLDPRAMTKPINMLALARSNTRDSTTRPMDWVKRSIR